MMNPGMDSDLDSFFNFDQNELTPLTTSSDIKPVPSLVQQSSSLAPFANRSIQQTFSGPSYQYDSHRQQTGLPVGALANTHAVNQASGLHYRPGNHGFVMPTETLNIPLHNLEDFNRSQFEIGDMDFDADSPSDLPAIFYPSSSQNFSPAQQAPPRIYPGMHTEQAAQAKAQRQEQLKQQQQPKQIPGQRPLPTSTPKTSSAKDPHVEESISRLLSRMRQSSSASNDDDEDSPIPGMSNIPRLKKDEDEMDDDERLLNSEEGKKLSSKERRQLRNKVSARAFRSRRKEYITQLEGEVAVKVQEANDLRVQNRQLMEENTRLTDLTRMLLSSQAFSGFLQELSNTGNTSTNNVIQQMQQVQQQQQRPVRKDISAHEASRQAQSQNQTQVGMTLVPETTFDMTMLENSNNWNTVLPSNDFQVYAVTALPEPPQIDFTVLSGKGQRFSDAQSKDMPSIPQIPVLPTPASKQESATIDESIELDPETFGLYYEATVTRTDKVSLSLPLSLSRSLTKVAAISELVHAAKTPSEESGSWEALEKWCAVLEETSDRLMKFVPE